MENTCRRCGWGRLEDKAMICLCEECKHAKKIEKQEYIRCDNPASNCYREVMQPGCGHCAFGEMKEDEEDGE